MPDRHCRPALAALALLGLPALPALAESAAPTATSTPAEPAVAVETETEPFTIGVEWTFRSEILGEERTLLVHTPASFEFEQERAYPVVFLLDPASHFHHTTGSAAFLARVGRAPEMVVVGIRNTERSRDMTPSVDPEFPGDGPLGGADDFLRFITDELSPWMDERYRTRTPRILIGHSFGGLFGIHVLQQKPDFFQGIIAISPSMQWHDEQLATSAWDWLQGDGHQNATLSLYITAGNEGAGLLGGAHRVAGALSSHAPSSLRWALRHMADETHGSVPFRSTYDGLEWIFDGWLPPDIAEKYQYGGWSAINAHYAAVFERLRWEGDTPESVRFPIIFGYLEDDQLDSARQFALDTAERFGPVPQGFWKYLASEYKEQGDTAGERACYESALQSNPSDTWAREQLERAGGTPPPLPETCTVDRAVLESYTGSYTTRFGNIEITLIDSTLHADAPGLQTKLLAMSETEFRGDDGATWTFVRGGDGTMRVTVSSGGMSVHGTRQ